MTATASAPVIWIHCGEAREAPSTVSLAHRLTELGQNARVLITADATTLDAIDLPEGLAHLTPVPAETTTRIREFWTEWRPRYLIWNGCPLRPTLLRWAHREGLPATFINARIAGLLAGTSRWMPGAVRAAVAPFERIMTADGATATRLTRGGVPRDTVTAVGPILEEPLPLPHDPNEMAVMAEAVEARPIWLAADIVPAEVKHMAAAHRVASRKSHRLLMIVIPRDEDSGPSVAATLREAGLNVGLRSAGDDPLPENQAYIADLPGEIGLWYRLAPLSFVGGTLSGGGAASPFDAIALGSAVVHGTRKAPHQARFARLADAEASREIRSASELGIAIGTLILPEKTARMALAGWEEVTRNAAPLNDLARTALDRAEVGA